MQRATWINTSEAAGDDLMSELDRSVHTEGERFDALACTLDIYFLAYLRRFARFGYFTFGPINIDLGVVEDIIDRITPKRPPGVKGRPPFAEDFDFVRFSKLLMEEVRRSGRRQIDELHFLLAFMRVDQGLPKRVFGELGVAPEQVEEFARNGVVSLAPELEKLFSPEDAAEYLNVHVQTVRAWIRSGRLRASRLAGQRALRITASDLQSVLEPVSTEDP
jgi:excisionase family DNA binding protein